MTRIGLLASALVVLPALLSGSSPTDYELPYELVSFGGGSAESENYQAVAEISIATSAPLGSSSDYQVSPIITGLPATAVDGWRIN